MLKKIVIASFAGLVSFAIHAAPETTGDESFQRTCTNAWMQKAEDANKIDYKNFGEKYCDCASKQPLQNEAAIQKAAQLCISRTLLQDAMDSLEDEVGLSKIKEADIADYCQDRWNLIYPKQTDDDKKQTMAYCECAKTKLMTLVQQSNNMTDKQYSDEVDKVAAECSGNALTNNPGN